MSKKSVMWFLSALMVTAAVICMPLDRALGTGSTIHPWPSFRHDLLNSGAATDSGYPTSATKLWMIDREHLEDRVFALFLEDDNLQRFTVVPWSDNPI